MDNVNIIVMGKTGAGKSTLINAVLGEDTALNKNESEVTKKNVVYSKSLMVPIGKATDSGYRLINYRFNMYDTVGLEIDERITEATLNEIQSHIQKTKEEMPESDIHLVWFCVNDRGNRFESYEIELIRKLSFEYEIPFIIVLTQCFSDGAGELEAIISDKLPNITQMKVLAKDYKVRGGNIIYAFGVSDLVNLSVNNYKNIKIDIIEKKLNKLDVNRMARIDLIRYKGNSCISKYENSAAKIGIVPVGCIPIVHGICIKMIAELNSIAGLDKGKAFADEVFADVVVGLVATPFMAIPLLSSVIAQAYVKQVGEGYLEVLLTIIDQSTDHDLLNNQLMKRRLKEELIRLKK